MKGIFLRRRGHFLRDHWFALILVWLLFFERLLMLSRLGAEYTLGSDDLSYVKAGITFYRTNTITMHGVVSAQIMPGLPVLISLFVALFGTGHRLWLALKMFWCLLGTLAAWFTYLAIDEKAPKVAAILPIFLYFTPDFAWQDNLILTETPFMFLTCLYIYGLFRSGNRQDSGSFFIVFGSAFLAFMLKAQASIFLLLPILYLWIKKYPSGRLYLQCFIGFCLLVAFIVPWSVRNYYHFGDFIPATYGIGNPLLLGTYQGEGYPSDEEVFTQEEIDKELLQTYRRFGDDFDQYAPKHLRYVYMKGDELKARVRMRYWWRHDRESMLKSYLYLKPKKMLFETFYWDEVVPGTKAYIEFSRRIDFTLAMLAVPAAIAAKRYIAEVCFVVIAYWIQVYMYAYAYVFDRYAQTLLPFRYIAIGFLIASCCLLFERFSRRVRHKRAMRVE
ncbi:MAG: hypothetical protein PUG99_02865 [Firmicutes bacterium]|nr:hypothetical protein [Peptoniphilus sp.]MDD7363079.1 hypothetical protein [Bacillota bacterium]